MYGKKYMGVERSTFVIAADGTLAKVMRKVKPETHADDVLGRAGVRRKATPRRPARSKTGPSGPRSHMRMRGLEPPRPERHTDLNRARLPIPPHPRAEDSSRHCGVWHAARQPPFRIGVIPIVNRLLALLGAVGLCCLAAACGSAGTRQRLLRRASAAVGRAARSSSRSRLRRSRADRVARPRRARRDRPRAGALRRRAPRGDPERADPLALPPRAQRRRRRRPEQRAPPPAGAPRRPGGRRRSDLHGRQDRSGEGREGGRDLADGAPQPGRRHQDRDHRRRRRPDAPVLRSRRLHDARRLPEGPGRLHDGQGDRRPRVRAGRDHVEVRAQALRPGRSPGTRPTSRASRPGTPAPPPPAASRSRASRRGRTSATTRR